MERGRSIQTDQAPGLGVPSAPMPGRGIGNIPYAKGMASGQFGSRVAAIQPRQAEPPPGPSSAPGPQAPSGPGGPPMPGGPPPAGPGQQSPFLDPMFYFDVMQSIMQAFVSAAGSESSIY